MMKRSALICAVVLVTSCASLPETNTKRPTIPPDYHSKNPVSVIESVGPLDLAHAMAGFRPPEGVADIPWHTPLDQFHGLVHPSPVWMAQFASRGKVVSMECISVPECVRYPGKQIFEGDGVHVLAEYYNKDYVLTLLSSVTAPDGAYTDVQAIKLPTNLLMFCTGREISPDISRHLGLCGMRMFFDTETPEQIATKSDDPKFVSIYDHVLVMLVRDFGAPADYEDCFRVTITTPDEVVIDKKKKKKCAPLRTWSWCPLTRPRQLSPACPASITLAYDPLFKTGVIIFATKPVWHFANAQYESGGDSSLYEMLNGLPVTPHYARMRKKTPRKPCFDAFPDSKCPDTVTLKDRQYEQLREHFIIPRPK